MRDKPTISSGHVVEPGQPREFYVDGISSSFLGAPVSKITFHSVNEIDSEGKERRQPIVRLVIQTGALLEFCRNTLAISMANQDGIEAGYTWNSQQIQHFLQGIEISELPPPPSIKFPENP